MSTEPLNLTVESNTMNLQKPKRKGSPGPRFSITNQTTKSVVPSDYMAHKPRQGQRNLHSKLTVQINPIDGFSP